MPARAAVTKFDLGYPPWALDFDPYNRGYLLVCGGGGEGQSEVPNSITLLDVASRTKIIKSAEVQGAGLEDCPMSLAVLGTKEGLIGFAGVNSRAEYRKKGVNEHLRTYKINYPNPTASRDGSGTAISVGRTTLFTAAANSGDVYQRLLRLSPPGGEGKRIGGAANCMAKESQIVLFNATTALPTAKDVIARIAPPDNAETEDLDLYEAKPAEFQLAYSAKNKVYAQWFNYDFATKKSDKISPAQPAEIYTIPMPSTPGQGVKPKIRGLRFLCSTHVILLENRETSSNLVILRLFQKDTSAEVMLRKQLPKRLTGALSLEVLALEADPDTGARQIVVAVVAKKEDISIYSLNYSGPNDDIISTFTLQNELRGVHKAAMRKVALAVTPYYKTGEPKREADSTMPQYLRVASISLSNTIVVDHLDLSTEGSKRGHIRHVLAKKARSPSSGGLMVTSFALLVILLGIQVVLNVTQFSPMSYLPEPMAQRIKPYTDPISDYLGPILGMGPETIDPITHFSGTEHLGSLLNIHVKSRAMNRGIKQAIVIRAPDSEEAELMTEVHHDTGEALKEDENAKRWDELSKSEKAMWKQRLTDAGVWSARYGETLLKGVFFSEVAGAVGRAMVGN